MTMLSMFQRVRKAVTVANNRRGYGNVKTIKLFLDGRIEVTITRPFMPDTVRKGRIDNGRVRFAGTSAKIEG